MAKTVKKGTGKKVSPKPKNTSKKKNKGGATTFDEGGDHPTPKPPRP